MPAVEGDCAYFLHQTPYRENSAIAPFLTRQNGKVSFIVTGLKAKRNAKRPFLQPCRLLCLNYQLRSGLSKLDDIDFADAEKDAKMPAIEQFMLYQYANELLLTILPEQLPTPALFADYGKFLTLLSEQRPHAALRHIEMALLVSFSGLPTLDKTEDTRQAIVQSQNYWFSPEQGIFSHRPPQSAPGISVTGAQVLAFQHIAENYLCQGDAVDEVIAQGAKPLTGSLISQLLNGKRLKTRKVFAALQKFI